MKRVLICIAVVTLGSVAAAEPTVYTDEAAFFAALAALAGSTVHESFEDEAAWADSRNSIVAPGSAPSVTSQGLVWTSNHAGNQLATGTVGGSAPDGAFAVYSLPHGLVTDSGLYCDSAEDPDIPVECFQDDGLMVASESGGALYAFGGRIDTANAGKVTFLLDGVDVHANDTDNVGNWQREGEPADAYSFVGVIDPAGFASVELRELRGKDFDQVLLFADDFTIRRAEGAACANGLDDDGDGLVDFAGGDPGCADPAWPLEDPRCQDGVDDDGDGRTDFDGGQSIWGACTGAPGGCPAAVSDPDGDGVADPDPQCGGEPWRNRETRPACGLGAGLALLLPGLLRQRRRNRSPHA